MLHNYLIIAFRNLWRNKVYSAINIVGLAIAFASSFLIFLWVHNELTVDKFHEKGERIFLAMHHTHFASGYKMTAWNSPVLLAEVMQRTIPEIEKTVYVSWRSQHSVCVGNVAFRETGIYASKEFFTIFSFPLLQGSRDKLLLTPNDIVISAKLAVKFFGANWKNKNLIGKTINLNRRDNFRITGVFETVPPHASSLTFDFVLNQQKIQQQEPWRKEWGNTNDRLFILLKDKTQLEAVNAKVKDIMKLSPNYNPSAPVKGTTFLYPLQSMHLGCSFDLGEETIGRWRYVYIFSFAAIFLIFIATINFINLTTALSITRLKEIGIRKVNGATEQSLVWYFIGESFLIVFSALLLSLLLIIIVFPYYKMYLDAPFSVTNGSPILWVGILVLAICICLLGGMVPFQSLIFSSSTSALSGQMKKGARNRVSKSLVVLQYSLSTVLMIGTLFIYMQLNFIRTKNMGLDRHQILYSWLQGNAGRQYAAIKNILLQNKDIENVSCANQNLMDVSSSTTDPTWIGKMPQQEAIFSVVAGDYNFLELMKVQLKNGRFFSDKIMADSFNLVINETAAKVIGKTNPIGMTIEMWGRKGQVVGVVKDFHQHQLQQPISPLVVHYIPPHEDLNGMLLYMRYKPGKAKEAVGAIKKIHQIFTPEYPLDYRFLDDDFNESYKTETIVGVLVNCFSAIALFISCLGLFALALLTIQKRTKEIGIRKILGASVAQICWLISKDFIKLVLLAILFALPFAFYIVNNWLESYAYHIDLLDHWWLFLLTACLVCVVAVLTIGFQTYKTALVNPVNSLRSE